MAKFELKIQAREIRKTGKSLKEIARILGVSKSSVSLWCRDIVLTEEQMVSLSEGAIRKGLKGRMMGAEANRNKKRKALAEANEWAKNTLQDFSKRDLLIAGIALYWAEGSKTDSHGTFSFSNSDSRMISLMCEWLGVFFQVSSTDFSPRITINKVHESRIEKVKEFWSNLLKVPTESISATFTQVIPIKIYENHDTYYGVLSLRLKKGTFIRYKVLALIETLVLENIHRKNTTFSLNMSG
jgi:transcriptional regulator with XRE-family HTH domain